MLYPPGFYFVKKPKRFVILSSDKSSECNLSSFFDVKKLRTIEHLQSEEPISSDPYFNVIFEVLKLALNIEIVIEFWIFVFFQFSAEKKTDLKKYKSLLYRFSWGTLIAWRYPKMQNLVAVFFSWKLKENEDSKFEKNFNIRRQFKHSEYDMSWIQKDPPWNELTNLAQPNLSSGCQKLICIVSYSN